MYTKVSAVLDCTATSESIKRQLGLTFFSQTSLARALHHSLVVDRADFEPWKKDGFEKNIPIVKTRNFN